MRHLLHRFSGDQSGVTAIEDGLIVGLIVLGIISLTLIGTTISANFFGPIGSAP